MFGRIASGNSALSHLRDEVDRLVGHMVDGSVNWTPLAFNVAPTYPALNVWETEEALAVEAELPGFKMENIELSVMGRELTIKGERSQESATDATWHRRERSAGTFARVLRLPFDVDAEKIAASFKDGVLHVTLPKAEAARPRRIEVKTGNQ